MHQSYSIPRDASIYHTKLSSKWMRKITFFFFIVGCNASVLADQAQWKTENALGEQVEAKSSIGELFISLSHEGADCLLASQVDDIYRRVNGGENVRVQVEGRVEELITVDSNAETNKCFVNAQGLRVCIQPSTRCEASPFGPRHRHLQWADEEYDRRCQAYIASLDPRLWEYIQSLMPTCVEDCKELGCPCICFEVHDEFIPEDFVVPDDFEANPVDTPPSDADDQSLSNAPSDVPSSLPTSEPKKDSESSQPCRFRPLSKRCHD